MCVLCIWVCVEWRGGGVKDCGPTDHRKPQETGGEMCVCACVWRWGLGVVVVGSNMERHHVTLSSSQHLSPWYEQEHSEMKKL